MLEANRPGRGKLVARDIILMNISYPGGNFVSLINGIITDGIPFSPVANSGRLKTRSYSFVFENRIGG